LSRPFGRFEADVLIVAAFVGKNRVNSRLGGVVKKGEEVGASRMGSGIRGEGTLVSAICKLREITGE